MSVRVAIKKVNNAKSIAHLINIVGMKIYIPIYKHVLITLSKVIRTPIIYVIGDSHTTAFRATRPFVVYHLGPATAHNLNNDKSTTQSKRKLLGIFKKINSRDVILLVFGEIDCRIHIYDKFVLNKGKYSISELIDDTILNYGNIIKLLGSQHGSICVYGVTSPSRNKINPKYPYYCPAQTRKMIIQEFNQKLGNFCETNNYCFVDVNNLVSDNDGYLIDEYTNDNLHLNSKVTKFVKRVLEDKKLLR